MSADHRRCPPIRQNRSPNIQGLLRNGARGTDSRSREDGAMQGSLQMARPGLEPGTPRFSARPTTTPVAGKSAARVRFRAADPGPRYRRIRLDTGGFRTRRRLGVLNEFRLRVCASGTMLESQGPRRIEDQVALPRCAGRADRGNRLLVPTIARPAFPREAGRGLLRTEYPCEHRSRAARLRVRLSGGVGLSGGFRVERANGLLAR